jgi:hypothetical protein
MDPVMSILCKVYKIYQFNPYNFLVKSHVLSAGRHQRKLVSISLFSAKFVNAIALFIF